MTHDAKQIKDKIDILLKNYIYRYSDHPYYRVVTSFGSIEGENGFTVEFGLKALKPAVKLYISFTHSALSIRKSGDLVMKNYPMSIFMASDVPGLFITDWIKDCIEMVDRRYYSLLTNGLSWEVDDWDTSRWKELAAMLTTRDGTGFVYKRKEQLYIGVCTDAGNTVKTLEFDIAVAKDDDGQMVILGCKDGKHIASVKAYVRKGQSYEKVLFAFTSMVNRLAIYLAIDAKGALKTRWTHIQRELDDTSEGLTQ